MKTKLALLALCAVLFGTGCAASLRVHPRPSPMPAPNPPPVAVIQPMSYQEAINAGLSYAHQRGYDAHVKQAHLTGNDIWKVKLGVSRPNASGKLHLEFDAYSRSLIKADEKVKARHGKHSRDRDDDQDDDDDDDERQQGHRASAVGRD